MSSLSLLFFFKVVLKILGLLHFHINFGTGLSISTKMSAKIWRDQHWAHWLVWVFWRISSFSHQCCEVSKCSLVHLLSDSSLTSGTFGCYFIWYYRFNSGCLCQCIQNLLLYTNLISCKLANLLVPMTSFWSASDFTHNNTGASYFSCKLLVYNLVYSAQRK